MSKLTSLLVVSGATLALLALCPGPVGASGEPVSGFPNWAERVILEWSNRARCDPQVEMTACGSNCGEAACYSPIAPLAYQLELNRAARFHSDEMRLQSYFGHDSMCTVVPDIDSLYPDTCDGDASCACVGGTATCNPSCTTSSERATLFGWSPWAGEVIAGSPDPDTSFYMWLYEPTADPGCYFTMENGHRWLILTTEGSMGAGVSGRCTGEFRSVGTAERIPSGAHYPRQASSVEVWVNWYDAAGPSEAWVNVDGTCTALSLGRGSQENGAWTATLSDVASGCFRYYFELAHASGAAVTYPTTGSFGIGPEGSCADWTSERPTSCLDLDPLVFADGFESGDTDAWSEAVP
jgi:hypothetical protein